jgi:hypothetical protein
MNVAKQARIRPTNSVVRAVSYDHNFLQYLPMGTNIKLFTVVIYDHKFLQYLPIGTNIKLFTVVIYDHNLFTRLSAGLSVVFFFHCCPIRNMDLILQTC